MTEEQPSLPELWEEHFGDVSTEVKQLVGVMLGMVGFGFGIGVVLTISVVASNAQITGMFPGTPVQYHITHESIMALRRSLMAVALAVVVTGFGYAGWIECRRGDSGE